MAEKDGEAKPPLVIVGPRAEIGMVVERTRHFLQMERYPRVGCAVEVVDLRPGSKYETDRLRVATAQTLHPTVGLCYRFEDKQTGAVVAITGDTAYHPALSRHVANADLLVHEASHGPVSRDPLLEGGHSGALDAANIAKAAAVKRLCLVHFNIEKRAEIVRAARDIFPETYAPEEGEVVSLPA